MLKSWNPDWIPPFVLCDYSEAEISAIEHTFPGTSVFLCDFNFIENMQAWTGWVNAGLSPSSRLPVLPTTAPTPLPVLPKTYYYFLVLHS